MWHCCFTEASLKKEMALLRPLFSSLVLLSLIHCYVDPFLIFLIYCFTYIIIFAVGFVPLCWLKQRLSEFPCPWTHFLLAAVSSGASNHIAIATTMHAAATVTNTSRTTSPVTPSLRRDALEQMLGSTVRFLDVSHISLELGAVATAVCKHCKSSIKPGKENSPPTHTPLTSSFLNHP